MVKPLPRPIPPADAELMVDIALSDPDRTLGIRDWAAMRLLWHGLRVAEVCWLPIRDLELDRVDKLGRPAPRVMVRFGKGGRDRPVVINLECATAIKQQISDSRGVVRVSGPVFPGRGKGRSVTYDDGSTKIFEAGTWTPNGVQRMIRRRAEQARVSDPQLVVPHAFRHACGVRLLKAGVHIRHIQAYLGHASIKTTEKYLIIEDQDTEDAVRGAFA